MKLINRDDYVGLGLGALAALVFVVLILFCSAPASGAVEGVPPGPPDMPICDVPMCEASLNACIEAQAACERAAEPDETPVCPTPVIEASCVRWRTRWDGNVQVWKCIKWMTPALRVNVGDVTVTE